jgi:hypothetical protein
MTATLSCPEIARLSLFADLPQAYEQTTTDRLPNSLKHYLPEGMNEQDALTIHHAFLNATADPQADAEQIFLRVACASRQMQNLPQNNWAILASFYLSDADLRIPPAQSNVNDAFNLLHALCGLMVASHKPASPRLLQTIADMETALACKLDWNAVTITTSPESLLAYHQLQILWHNEATMIYTPILRRWLSMQLALTLHPFGGLGATLAERVTLMGVRLAIIKLALLCAHATSPTPPDGDHIVRIVQSLSRFLDHLGTPEFFLQICSETSWSTEARMHGLLRQ